MKSIILDQDLIQARFSISNHYDGEIGDKVESLTESGFVVPIESMELLDILDGFEYKPFKKCKSRSEAKRKIKEGAIAVNGMKVEKANFELLPFFKYTHLKFGKRSFLLYNSNFIAHPGITNSNVLK